MRDRLWIGSFWHQLLYPELGPGGFQDPTGMLASAVRRVFGSSLPEHVVAARIHYDSAAGYVEQRAVAASVLGHLHHTLALRERRLLGFVHGRFLYCCGYFPPAEQQGEISSEVVATDLTNRLRELVGHLREEHDILLLGIAADNTAQGKPPCSDKLLNTPWWLCALSCRSKKATCSYATPQDAASSASS